MERPKFLTMFFDVVVGAIFVLFNFNGFIRYTAHHWFPDSSVAGFFVEISHWPDYFIPTNNAAKIGLLGNMVYLCFIGLWIYVGGIVLLAIVKATPRIAVNGGLGLLAGASTIHLVGWIGVVLAFIVGVLFAIFTFIRDLLQAIFLFLAPYLAWIFFVFGWIVLVAGGLFMVGAIIFAVYQLIKNIGLKGVIIAVASGTIFFFAWPLLREFYEFYLLPILRWVQMVLSYVVSAIGFLVIWAVKIAIVLAIIISALGAVLAVIGSLGHLLVDQFKAAWNSGSGHRGILLGAFGVGLSLAVIIWVTSGSPQMTSVVAIAWHSSTPAFFQASPVEMFNALLPTQIISSTPTLFATASAPIFDAFALLVLLGVSYAGFVRGFQLRRADEYHTTFFSKDLLKIGGLMILALPALAVVILAAAAPKDD